MKKVFYIVFFINFAAFSSFAQTNDELKALCLKNMQNPELVITTSFGNLKYDHTRNKRTITRMHVNKYKGRVAPNNSLNGLSTFEYALNINFKLKKQTLHSGVVCVYPSHINLNIGAGEDPVIYIARNYQKDSCMYNLVLRHEQTHQQINQTVLEYYLPIIKERLIDLVRKNAIAAKNYDININMAQNELKEKYLTVLNELLDEIKRETEAEQQKLDNQQNYDHEAQICADKT